MCGIAGWYARGNRKVEADAVRAQCDAIIHRGPDDSGLHVDGDFAFGMRRLSIIDIEGGHQPIVSHDERYVIVFNGEIYNHPELREQLSGHYPFRTSSDTETILAAYRHWGDGAWLRLEGMFAVAIWDRQARSLVLARDPFGIKPLYLTCQQGGLAFASELKALLPLRSLDFDVDPAAVHEFFSFGHVRQPRSIYRQVRQLEPGSFLRIGPSGEPVQERYWTAEFRIASGTRPEVWIEEFRERWQASVRSHMLADVPVGVFLSGGIDSSAVTAAMSKYSGRPVKAFTIGFPGTRFDETSFARSVAQHLGCEHHVETVELQRAANILPRLQDCFDEPFADPAAIPNWYVAKLAAQHVKVVLSGEGGDEIFAGYKRHRNEKRMSAFGPLLRTLRPLASALDTLPASSSQRLNFLRQRIRHFHETASLPTGAARFFAKTQITSADFRRDLYHSNFKKDVSGDHLDQWLQSRGFASPEAISRNGLEQFMYADLAVNLPSAMLTKVDRTTMAHSLEARVPFLSRKLVDWAMTMPIEMKLRGKIGKHVVREAIKPWLPADITARGKQGFQVPLSAWFAGGLGDYARETWHDSGAEQSGFFEKNAFDRVVREHRQGISNNARALLAATMFALWWQGKGGSPSQHDRA